MLKTEFDERLNRQNTEFAAFGRDLELQIKEAEDALELSRQSFDSELKAALASKEEAESNEKAWREKIEDLEKQLAEYGDVEKNLDVLREKVSFTESKLKEASERMKQLESEEIEAKATRMSAREKIAELESALANPVSYTHLRAHET